MTSELSEAELNEFHEIFNLVDTRGSGYITVEELRKLMDTLHLRPTEEELAVMFSDGAEAEAEAERKVDFEQFAAIMSHRVHSEYTPEQLRNAFRVFETEDFPPGYVSTEILQYALMNYGAEKLSSEDASRLLAAVDPEGTGHINYMDFVAMLGKQVAVLLMTSGAVAPAVLRLAYRATHPICSTIDTGGNVYVAHGLLGNAMNWSTAAQRLVRHSALTRKISNVYALDMRNHGGSPHSADHSADALASDLELFALRPPMEAQKVGGQAASLLMGHSMGGLAVMCTLLRRYNEAALLTSASGVVGQRNFGHWPAEERAHCAAMMRAVNAACGVDTQQSLRDLLYLEATSAAPRKVCDDTANITAAVIVDITPTALLAAHDQMSLTTLDTLHAMTKVDLRCVHSQDDVKRELERAGIADPDMRSFVATNMVLKKGQPAVWRCNLNALAQRRLTFQPSIVRWFEDATHDARVTPPTPCTLPILFVFGEKSEYNNAEHRARIPTFFPNATQVVVPGAGHFVHYEKVDAFVDAVAPFMARHLL